ncbi:ubiquitin-conjugating enzyme E2 1 [Trichinella spiralis]|uniref:ubiquitin-conjugating enzyme E2 1 n=1 Tax=Trichinella spiralis TaxID=6334 RepID=UPI0001EFEABA|nr:ubiquitin-conjugating enzyme E2 1 [Trichinella spiralis]
MGQHSRLGSWFGADDVGRRRSVGQFASLATRTRFGSRPIGEPLRSLPSPAYSSSCELSTSLFHLQKSMPLMFVGRRIRSNFAGLCSFQRPPPIYGAGYWPRATVVRKSAGRDRSTLRPRVERRRIGRRFDKNPPAGRPTPRTPPRSERERRPDGAPVASVGVRRATARRFRHRLGPLFGTVDRLEVDSRRDRVSQISRKQRSDDRSAHCRPGRRTRPLSRSNRGMKTTNDRCDRVCISPLPIVCKFSIHVYHVCA